jgi:dephospho-CoA kinase
MGKRMKKRPATRIIGLTGGIASGKSTVVMAFAKRGARIIDADAIGREAVEPGRRAWRGIIRAFGKGILRPDKSIDRKKLGSVVFADAKKRKRLEAIVHPEVIAGIKRQLRRYLRTSSEPVIVDVPLLFESRLQDLFDAVVVVWIPQRLQLERLRKREPLPLREALDRVRAQMPLKEKKERADFVIDNSKGRTYAAAQVKKLWGVLTKL